MGEYNEECLKTFLEKQEQLFDEPVAETLEAAEAFLEDCMAVVVESLAEVREYFEENGMDVDGMSEEELERGSGIALHGSSFSASGRLSGRANGRQSVCGGSSRTLCTTFAKAMEAKDGESGDSCHRSFAGYRIGNCREGL